MENIDDVVQLLSNFIRINTTNPPGNEEEGVLFLEDILLKAGLPTEVYSPAPKRANLLSRIKGKKRGKAMVLLGHIDVVPARAEEWDVDPFGGEIKDGYIYGRGTIDMKGQVICQLIAFIDLFRRGVEPERDIIFLATCDEETGGKNGVEFMLNEVKELKDVSFVLSEGGFIIKEGESIHGQVSVSEKMLSQFMIRATGTGGHGSKPHKDNANEKVVEAAHRILNHKWPIKNTAIVNAYMNGIFRDKTVAGMKYKTLKEAMGNKKFVEFIDGDPLYNALLRNTVTLTVIRGGEKVNVIPTEAQAYFDARLLPGEKHETFFKRIRSLAGKGVEVLPLKEGLSHTALSGYNSKPFKGIKDAVIKTWGRIPVLPFITTGATDLRYFRKHGITAYGFFPIVVTNDDLMRMHGKNERISIENLREGVEGIKGILDFLASYDPL
ncbi:MAG: M20/M25/M40 family metallo-hydrolase [Syntrophorhabdaceae bacterium]|nr:M20/M25/M40 family metallo-hydrolase [Syntrophorhabdaceae bacterium]